MHILNEKLLSKILINLWDIFWFYLLGGLSSESTLLLLGGLSESTLFLGGGLESESTLLLGGLLSESTRFFLKFITFVRWKFSTENICAKIFQFHLGGLESESTLFLLGGLVSESNLFRLGDDDLRFGLFSGFFGDRSFLAGLDFRLGDRSEFLPIAFQPSCFFRSSSGRSSITDATVGAFSPSNSNSARDFISSQLTSLSIIAMFPKI